MYEDLEMATPCCSFCDNCPYYLGKKEPKCEGCYNAKGKPFWGECELFSCAQKKKVEHCGLCGKFPCERLITHFDPNNPRGPQEAIFRIGLMALRKKLGTKEWIELRSKGKIPNFD